MLLEFHLYLYFQLSLMLGTRKPEQITCIENVLSNKPDSDFILKIREEVLPDVRVLTVANMLTFSVTCEVR